MRPSYQKPTGGFLAIGPRYPGELVDDGTSVRVHHHGAPKWVEVVPIEHVEKVESRYDWPVIAQRVSAPGATDKPNAVCPLRVQAKMS